jgi:hypothetical protein
VGLGACKWVVGTCITAGIVLGMHMRVGL